MPLEDSLVAGTWRIYRFNDLTWALEPIGRSESISARGRTYYSSLADALTVLLGKNIGDGTRLVVATIKQDINDAEMRVRQSVLEFAETLRLKGLAL